MHSYQLKTCSFLSVVLYTSVPMWKRCQDLSRAAPDQNMRRPKYIIPGKGRYNFGMHSKSTSQPGTIIGMRTFVCMQELIFGNQKVAKELTFVLSETRRQTGQAHSLLIPTVKHIASSIVITKILHSNKLRGRAVHNGLLCCFVARKVFDNVVGPSLSRWGTYPRLVPPVFSQLLQ